jgi:hypothetical protein
VLHAELFDFHDFGGIYGALQKRERSALLVGGCLRRYTYLHLPGEFLGVDNGPSIGIEDGLVECASIETVEKNVEKTSWWRRQWPSQALGFNVRQDILLDRLVHVNALIA